MEKISNGNLQRDAAAERADALLDECDYDWLEQRGKIENEENK